MPEADAPTAEESELYAIFGDLDTGPSDAGFDPSAAEAESTPVSEDEPSEAPSPQDEGGTSEAAAEPNEDVVPPTPKAQDQEPEGDSPADPPATDWEKRFKDTQKSFNQERQARLDLERKFNEFQQAQEAGKVTAQQKQDADAILKKLEADFENDPSGATKEAIRQVQQMVNQVKEAQQQTRAEMENARAAEWSRKEAAFKANHPDYDEIVTQEFVNELMGSETLRAQLANAGGTVEAAYELATRYQYLRTGQLPASVKKEESAAPEAPPKKQVKTLSDVASAPPKEKKKGDEFNSISDVNRMLGLTL